MSNFRYCRRNRPYLFAFLYLDHTAGFSINKEGLFSVKDGKITAVEKREKSEVYIERLSKDIKDVHIMTDDEISILNVEDPPIWLENYKSDDNVYSLR